MSAAAPTAPAATLTARQAMIESQLKPCGLVSHALVAAFHAVPREDFVDPARRGLAYVDAAQPLGGGRTMMPPLSLGRLLQEGAPRTTDHALIVGAGTGYAAAILARLAGSVVALESDPALVGRARALLAGSPNVTVAEGPLEAGWPAAAPYSFLLVDGAIEGDLPDALVAQLADGAQAVAVVIGPDGVARAAHARKSAGLVRLEPFAEAPADLLPPFRQPPRFRF